jgi:hypothetical protein
MEKMGNYDAIQMYLRETGCDDEDRINPVQDLNHRPTFCDQLLNIRPQIGTGAIRSCNWRFSQ